MLAGVLNLDDKALERVAQAVKASVEFYVLASLREKPIFENTLARMDQMKTPVGVLVIGGFHTAGLKAQLRAKGFSYAVVMPRVSEIRPEDEKLYEDRLMDKHVPIEEALSDQANEAPGGASQTLSPGHALLQSVALRPTVQAVLANRLYRKLSNKYPDWSASKKIDVVSRSMAVYYSVPAEQIQGYLRGIHEAPEAETGSFFARGFLGDHEKKAMWNIPRAMGWLFVAVSAFVSVPFLVTMELIRKAAAAPDHGGGAVVLQGGPGRFRQIVEQATIPAHTLWNKTFGVFEGLRLRVISTARAQKANDDVNQVIHAQREALIKDLRVGLEILVG